MCIRCFAEGADGTIYAGSNSGLARIEEDKLLPIDDDRILGQTVYSLCTDAYGRIWGSLNQGICCVLENDKVAGMLSSELFFSDTESYCVASGKDGAVYVGTAGGQVARLECKDKELKKESFRISYYKTGNVTTHNQMHITEDGKVLIAGLQGFGCILPSGKFYQFGEEQKVSSLNAAIVDYEGNLWLASSTMGIIKYSKGCFETPNKEAQLSGVAINTIVKLGNEYYAGTDRGLLGFDKNWTPKQNELTKFLEADRIRQLLVDSKGTLWIASYYGHGAVHYDPKTEEIVCYGNNEGLVNEGVRSFLERADGTIAVATQNGVSIIQSGKVVKSYTEEDGLANSTILCLQEGKDGCLYAGSDGGGIYAIEGDKITNYGFDDGLNEGVVLRMLADTGASGMFVSAGSSLYYFEDGSFRKLTNFAKSSGSIFDFFLRDGKLWMMQNNGVLVADRAAITAEGEAETLLYGTAYGLTGSLNANTWNYLDKDGMLYLSTRSGVSLFRFQAVANPLPREIINEIRVDDVVYGHPSQLEVDESANRITIDFSALSYTGTTVSRMAYQLIGFDETETVISKKHHSISYTNLPGGNYTFYLKIYSPSNPGEYYETKIPIHKQKKLTEYRLFWILTGVFWLILLAGIAYTIAIVKIKRARRRQQEYKEIIEEFLTAFTKMIDAKDEYTNGHSRRVASYSREIAKRLNMPQEEQDRTYYIALMHDIGKIGIPDSILKKAGKLTEEEMNIIKTHPMIGGKILKDCTALKGLAEGAQYHHEHYDGSGYCMGLKGEEIPLIARIIGVADAYDAMSTTRYYRETLDKDIVIKELREGAGSQFSPEIVPIMLQMIEEGCVPIILEEKIDVTDNL